MTTTIALSSSARNSLTMIKVQEGYKNMDELVCQLIMEHKKIRLIKASEKVRARMKKLDTTVSDLIE